MKATVLGLLVSLAAASGVLAAPPSPEQAVLAGEDAFAQAMIAHDAAALKRLLAPEWTAGSARGKLDTRRDFLAELNNGDLVISKVRNHDLKVRVLGDIALVEGMDDETTAYKGKDISGTRTWLDVWALRGDHWVMVASHEAVMEQPAS